jgi:predicted nuclease with TOPRIM domain
MPLTEDDLKALRLLMREEIHDAFEQRFEPFRKEVNERFREVDGRFEDLYAQNERREQEYVFVREQLSRQEKQLTGISEQLSRHDQYFTDFDIRISELEKKRA